MKKAVLLYSLLTLKPSMAVLSDDVYSQTDKAPAMPYKPPTEPSSLGSPIAYPSMSLPGYHGPGGMSPSGYPSASTTSSVALTPSPPGAMPPTYHSFSSSHSSHVPSYTESGPATPYSPPTLSSHPSGAMPPVYHTSSSSHSSHVPSYTESVPGTPYPAPTLSGHPPGAMPPVYHTLSSSHSSHAPSYTESVPGIPYSAPAISSRPTVSHPHYPPAGYPGKPLDTMSQNPANYSSVPPTELTPPVKQPPRYPPGHSEKSPSASRLPPHYPEAGRTAPEYLTQESSAAPPAHIASVHQPMSSLEVGHGPHYPVPSGARSKPASSHHTKLEPTAVHSPHHTKEKPAHFTSAIAPPLGVPPRYPSPHAPASSRAPSGNDCNIGSPYINGVTPTGGSANTTATPGEAVVWLLQSIAWGANSIAASFGRPKERNVIDGDVRQAMQDFSTHLVTLFHSISVCAANVDANNRAKHDGPKDNGKPAGPHSSQHKDTPVHKSIHNDKPPVTNDLKHTPKPTSASVSETKSKREAQPTQHGHGPSLGTGHPSPLDGTMGDAHKYAKAGHAPPRGNGYLVLGDAALTPNPAAAAIPSVSAHSKREEQFTPLKGIEIDGHLAWEPVHETTKSHTYTLPTM